MTSPQTRTLLQSLATSAKAVLAIGVPFGFVSVVLAVLAGNVGVTLLVAGNAMRLSRVTPDWENGDV